MRTIFGCVGGELDTDALFQRAMDSLQDLPLSRPDLLRRADSTVASVQHSADDSAGLARDDDWTCMADARIDNRAEIERRLNDAGQLNSDRLCTAGLILAAFRIGGAQVWDWLRGDFACALWHPPTRQLVLARDVIGARPLYWAESGTRRYFASELRTLLAMRNQPLQVDLEQVQRQLYRGGSGAPAPGRTLLDGVMRVEPGCWRHWRGDQVESARYWDPSKLAMQSQLTEQQAADGLHERVLNAVLRRAAEGGEIGCHLSGGLDCSSIAAMLWSQRERTGKQPRLYSWTPREVEAEVSELQRIDQLVAMHGMSVEYLDAAQFSAAREAIAQRSIDPRYPWNSLGLEQHVQSAAKYAGVKHLMSGWGGDEASSHQGFGLAPELLLAGHWRKLHSLLAHGRVPGVKPRLRSFLRRARSELLQPLLNRLQRVDRTSVAAQALNRRFHFRPSRANALESGLSVRQTQLWRYFDGYLTERIESWYCHGKLHGITYSYPLLDRDVLEWGYTLPGWHFAQGGVGRRVFRLAMQRYWPDGAVWTVPKDEPGLMGFLRSGAEMAERRSVLTAPLCCREQTQLNAELVDSAALNQLLARIEKTAGLADLELLGRADWVCRYARRLADMDRGHLARTL